MNAACAMTILTTCSRAPQATARTAAEPCQACSNATTQRAATAIATYKHATNDAPCAERREPYGPGCDLNYLKLCARTATLRQRRPPGDPTNPGFSAARPSLRRPTPPSFFEHQCRLRIAPRPRSMLLLNRGGGRPRAVPLSNTHPTPPLRSPFLPLGESARWSSFVVGPCVCGL